MGLLIEQEWHSLTHWLTTPTEAEIDGVEAKKIAGAWCPCALVGGVVAGGRGTFDVIAGDVDKCGADGFERTCGALAPYQGVVVSTCNRSDQDDRHRFVLVLERRMAIDEFPTVWRKLVRSLAAAGVVLDPVCKNANRLYFAPVQRRGVAFKVRTLTGAPVPIDRMLGAGRKFEAEQAERCKRTAPRAVRNGGRYAYRALERAAANVASAPEGERNNLLNKETHSVARLSDLSDREIADAMTDAARRAGLAELETMRTIESALRARRNAG